MYIERASKLGLVKYLSRNGGSGVAGMQAAFIDIGQSRTAFLHVNDMRRLPDPNKEASNISAVDKPSSQSEDDGIVEADLPKSELTPNETGDSDTTVNASQSIDTNKSLLDNAAHLVPPTRPQSQVRPLCLPVSTLNDKMFIWARLHPIRLIQPRPLCHHPCLVVTQIAENHRL